MNSYMASLYVDSFTHSNYVNIIVEPGASL